jgi:hypothetical protein
MYNGARSKWRGDYEMGIRENARRGKEGEEIAKEKLESSLSEVKKRHKDWDFTAVKKTFGGKVAKRKYVEVKTGRARLSQAQKEAKKRLGGRYKADRKNPWL